MPAMLIWLYANMDAKTAREKEMEKERSRAK
jgi:hypothetical protein